MKRLNGTIVQQLVNVKSIALMVLVWITFLSVSCNEKSTTAKMDVGGKGREIVNANATSVLAKEDVGGPKGQEIRFFVNEKQPAILILEVGGKSSSGSQMVTAFNDVGGRKTVSTYKNAFNDVGGRGAILTGNLFLVFHSVSDVGGTRDIKNIRKQVVTLYFDVGGKGIKNLRGVIPKTEFS